jgi:polyphenol oxidase
VGETLARLGTTDVVAAIGPAIGKCCFEVGPEVAEQFQPLFPETELSRTEKSLLDLREAVRRQLLALQVTRVETLDDCTKCGSEQFHSFRRDGQSAGRLLSAIRLL